MCHVCAQVRCVVSGFDIHINYAKVAKAISYLRRPGCLFVSTNTDTGLPCGADCLMPGNVVPRLLVASTLPQFWVLWTKVRRHNWHSAGCLGWPFPVIKFKYSFEIKYTEAILSNSSRKLLWFEIT